LLLLLLLVVVVVVLVLYFSRLVSYSCPPLASEIATIITYIWYIDRENYLRQAISAYFKNVVRTKYNFRDTVFEYACCC